MTNNKQSSIDWLAEQLKKDINLRLRGFDIDKALKQAKAMHKEQCINYAHDFARQMLQNRRFVTPEIIYNETFG